MRKDTSSDWSTRRKAQIELFPWYYHPLIGPVSSHPIVRNIDRLTSEFPSSIDTVKTKGYVVKTPILLSSKYSRYQLSPMKVGFDIMRYKPDIEKFDKPHLPIAYLLEGKFYSNYENRVEESMLSSLKSLNLDFTASTENNKMIVIADGDLVKICTTRSLVSMHLWVIINSKICLLMGIKNL